MAGRVVVKSCANCTFNLLSELYSVKIFMDNHKLGKSKFLWPVIHWERVNFFYGQSYIYAQPVTECNYIFISDKE